MDIIEIIKASYIEVYGAEKWNSLTDEQKHDAIMILAADALKALSKGN